MSFVFRIPYQGFLCPLFSVFLIEPYPVVRRIPMSFVFLVPYRRIPMSFIFRIPYQALSLEMNYQSNLKMPENLKNIPKPGEPVVWAAALSHNLAV